MERAVRRTFSEVLHLNEQLARRSHVDKYEVAKVSDDVYAVSYLGSAGYTLSLILNFRTSRM